MQSVTLTIAALGKLITGLQKDQPNGTFLLGGTTYTTTAVVQLLQSMINALNASVAARAAYQNATGQSTALLKANRTTVRDLKQSLQIMYGLNQTTLSDFGLTPRKTPVVSPAVKAAAADKAQATRVARHTMSKKQKAKITGATAVATTSSSVPATPAPAATPVVAAVAGTTNGGAAH